MLAVSEQATTAIEGIIANSEMSDHAGVRLSRDAGGEDGTGAGIKLELVDGPAPGDKVRFSVRPQG